jgi:transposase
VAPLINGELDRLILENHIEHIESINSQIKKTDEAIRERASRDEDVRLLLSLTGIDVYTALLIRSEIGPITRFPDYKRLVSWAGLAPSTHQSGSLEYHGRITKQGSRVLRFAIVSKGFGEPRREASQFLPAHKGAARGPEGDRRHG